MLGCNAADECCSH
jgi:dienelactone hydrolase